MNRLRVGVSLAAIALLASSVALSDDGKQKKPSPLVDKVREATAQYLDVQMAVAAGYFPGPCVSGPNQGAMGVHFIKAGLLGKEINVETPEALIYEPMRDGRMRLVGVEYITFASDWTTDVPTLEGHLFHLSSAPNRYGIPAFYELHVWAWRDNPEGTFSDWNTRVTCDSQPLP